MVTAHVGDVQAVKACDLQTVYFERPQEEGFDAERVETMADEEGFFGVAEKLAIQVEETRQHDNSNLLS